MIKILFKRLPIFIVLIFALLVSWPIFVPGYFSHHDDLQVMRVYEARKCIEDLQIPCRWVPDMGYGNGYPLFNYYAVSPYLLGVIFSYPLGFIVAAKLLFLIPILAGSISMFLLANEIFGKNPAILASVLYTFAPFKALDTYVRGDVAESFAMAAAPLIVYFALKLIRKKTTEYVIGLVLSLAIFLISHNIMTVLFAPVIFLLVIYYLFQKKWKNFLPLIFSVLLGIGLASFFIFPAYFERNLVQIDNLIKLELNFRAHFVTLNQLFFSRFWGYGASTIGPNDTISFQIGWPHWWLAFASLLAFFVTITIKKRVDSLLPLILFLIFLFSCFMTHVQSAFIWEKIEILKFVQFPWRFLAISIFSSSLLGAYLASILKEDYKKYFMVICIVLAVFLNFSFFKPKEFYPDMSDQKKLSGFLWEDQQKAAILDYLPQTAVQPRERAPDKPIIRSGNAASEPLENRSNRWQFKIKVLDKAMVEVPVFDFPVWKVWVNGEETSFSNKNYPGRISLNFDKPGNYLVSGKFTDTPVRQMSNIATFLSIIVLSGIVLYGKVKKNLS